MKWSLILISLMMVTSVHADKSRQWWQVSKSADETAGVTDRLFSPDEKQILKQYLRSQDLEDVYESEYEYEGDRGNNQKGKKHKDKNHKKDKKAKKQKALPKGLQKKVERGGQLPPGWQKKIARGEVLDGDLYEVSSDLPKGILDQLEEMEGTSVRQVEDQVIRVLDSTGEILDVLTGN